MTNCSYIIQLPGSGSGVITIPANFGTIENTPELKSRLESLDREADNFLEVISDIVDDLHELTGKTILTKEDIYDIIVNNLDNRSEIIPIINNIIENNSEFNGLAKAIKQFLIQQKNRNPYLAEELKQKLSNPITKEYFNRVSLSGIFNTTSIKSEHLKIQSIIGEETNSGLRDNYLYPLNVFLQSIKKYSDDLYTGNTLFSANNQFGTKSLNVNQLSFFKEGNFDSLFLSLFKRIGSNIDVNVLNSILDKDYKKSSDFFNQKLTKTKDIKNSDFENLIKDKNSDKKKIDAIIDQVTEFLGGNNTLKNSIKDLIINISPELFKDEYQNRIQLEELISKENSEFSKEFRMSKYSNILDKNISDLGKNYSEFKKIKSQNLYEEAINNIVPGQDLVKFTINNKSVNGLVTDIFVREKQGQITGVHLRGIYKTNDGKFEEISQDFQNSQTIEYKSKEDPILEYTENLLKNDKTIHLSKKLSQDSLKYLLKGGDIINNSYVVSGIYPEYIVATSGNTTTNIPYSKINSINSSVLYNLDESIDNIEDLPIIDNKNYIAKGDIIKYNDAYYPVIDVTPNEITVVSIVGRKIEVETIKDRNLIQEIRVGKLDSFSSKDTLNILENSNINSKNLQMSSFTDISKVKTNDLGSGEFDGENIEFKIVDSNTKRVVLNNGRYLTFESIQNPVFYTFRDISSKTALENIKANTFAVQVKDKTKPTDIKLRYVVPSSIKLNSLFLLPNNYANIGWYQEESKPLNKGEKDATNVILRLMKRKGVVGNSIYGEKENINRSSLKRNLNNYRKIERFSDLSSESKEALNILKSGTYFNIYTESSINPIVFRVTENKDNTIIAQYNTINYNGDIITVEREFNVKNLLSSKLPGDQTYPPGSIANLYLHYRNRNIKSVIEAIDQNQDPETIRSTQSITKLANAIENTFSKLNIPVVQTSDTFENGQHAKIHSDSQGNVSIVLNTKSGKFSDLIHETLHIYLTLLRYTDTDNYAKLVNSVVKSDINIYDKEEEFVKRVVEFTNGATDFLYEDTITFMDTLVSIVNKLVKDSTGEDLNINPTDIMTNPLEFLNTSLGSLYGINPNQNNHPLLNVGLLSVEPMYRNWLKDNGITLKCD